MMEQAIKGQMGQPAACMMGNKVTLSLKLHCADYGLPIRQIDDRVTHKICG